MHARWGASYLGNQLLPRFEDCSAYHYVGLHQTRLAESLARDKSIVKALGNERLSTTIYLIKSVTSFINVDFSWIIEILSLRVALS